MDDFLKHLEASGIEVRKGCVSAKDRGTAVSKYREYHKSVAGAAKDQDLADAFAFFGPVLPEEIQAAIDSAELKTLPLGTLKKVYRAHGSGLNNVGAHMDAPIIVASYNSKLYSLDGSHRINQAIIEGLPSLQALVVEAGDWFKPYIKAMGFKQPKDKDLVGKPRKSKGGG